VIDLFFYLRRITTWPIGNYITVVMSSCCMDKSHIFLPSPKKRKQADYIHAHCHLDFFSYNFGIGQDLGEIYIFIGSVHSTVAMARGLSLKSI
jgi:hypothetical protein